MSIKINPIKDGMDFDTILNTESSNLLRYLSSEYLVTMMDSIDDASDMDMAQKLLLKLTASKSYLGALRAYTEIKVRLSKRNDLKAEADIWIEKLKIIEIIENIAKEQYNGISRACTVHDKMLEELRMLSLA